MGSNLIYAVFDMKMSAICDRIVPTHQHKLNAAEVKRISAAGSAFDRHCPELSLGNYLLMTNQERLRIHNMGEATIQALNKCIPLAANLLRIDSINPLPPRIIEALERWKSEQ